MANKKRAKELVMEAIRQLRIERGFTPKEIIHYIETNHDVKAHELSRGVYAALKRGADYGLFKAQRGGRYALRLAPTTMQLAVRRKAEAEEDVSERGCAKKRRKSRRRRCCTKMWVPRRRRHKSGCKKRRPRRRKSSCKRRRRRTRKNRCKRRSRRSRKNRSKRRRRRSRKNRCKRSRRQSRRRRAKCRC